MKKGLKLFIVFLIALVALFSLSAAIFTPTIPPTCSENDIKAVWDSIFKETSSGITIFTNTTQNGRCNGYLAYKIQGNKGDILTAVDSYSASSNFTFLSAYEGNFTQDFINIVKNFSTFQNYSTVSNSLTNIPTYVKQKNFSIADASQNYTLAFEADVGTFSPSTISGITYYIYNQSESNATSTKKIGGMVVANYSLVYLTHESNYTSLSSCSSNWTAMYTYCFADDSYVIWYSDTNSCGNSTRPANITRSCDYDHNGIIGNLSQSALNSLSLDWYVNNNTGNLSSTYNTTKTMELREGNITRVLFDYAFSSPLNFKTLIVTKQPSSSNRGYLAVSGLSGTTKTFTVDKLMANSTKVCVLNLEATTISNMTSGCDSAWEYLFDCPGSSGSYKCNVTNNKLVVSGLTNSVVAEYTGQTNNTMFCTENWSCQDWTSCSSGIKTRTCIDTNNCRTTFLKPVLNETCIVILVNCKTNWSCSPWPTTCPSSGIKTRTCIDTNRCKSPLDIPRPELGQQCTNETNWTVIIIITTIALILIIAIVYFIMKSMSPKGSESYVNLQNLPRTPPSPIQFVQQRPVQQPRPFQPQPSAQPRPSPQPPSENFNPRPSGTNPIPAQPQRAPQPPPTQSPPPAQSTPPSQPENQDPKNKNQDNKKVDFEF